MSAIATKITNAEEFERWQTARQEETVDVSASAYAEYLKSKRALRVVDDIEKLVTDWDKGFPSADESTATLNTIRDLLWKDNA